MQDELGWNTYDFGARNYDPWTARWNQIDPLAEDFYSFSTYNAMMNDPINLIDPDGMAPEDWFKNQKGDIVWYDNSSESFENDEGKWENIGENLSDVKKNLGIDGVKTFEFTEIDAMLFTGVGTRGRRGGAPMPVFLKEEYSCHMI